MEKLREPAIECLDDVYHLLENLASDTVNRIFQRFPTLIPEIMDIIVTSLQAERDKTREVVESIIDSE